jgi:hypothetical protein
VRLPAGASPWLRALAHGRIGELCLRFDPGDEALHHLGATLAIMEELGAWSSAARTRWAMVLANLQRGAYDEAERGLDELAENSLLEEAGRQMFDVCARAEISLGRGDLDGGLRRWREAADRLRPAGDSWAREVCAVAVVAHAEHGRLDLVGDIAAELPAMLAATVDLPARGALLLAGGMVQLHRNNQAAAVRMIALAERLGFRQDFQPTMSGARIRGIAERTDRAAYDQAVSSYAGLDPDELRLIGSDLA